MMLCLVGIGSPSEREYYYTTTISTYYTLTHDHVKGLPAFEINTLLEIKESFIISSQLTTSAQQLL